MRVRLTKISGGIHDEADNVCIVDGAMADPPEQGKPFSVLVISHERLIVTHPVAAVRLDSFYTTDGTRYSWARTVGEA